MSQQIYNDLLFESEAAQREFQEYCAAVGAEEAEKLRSVLGKPSQFVGRVMNLAQALEHWRQWAVWQATEGAALEQQRAALAEEARNAPKLAVPKEDLEVARQEWHDAVECQKKAKEEWDAWLLIEVGKLRTQHANAIEQWRTHVAEKRAAYRRLKER